MRGFVGAVTVALAVGCSSSGGSTGDACPCAGAAGAAGAAVTAGGASVGGQGGTAGSGGSAVSAQTAGSAGTTGGAGGTSGSAGSAGTVAAAGSAGDAGSAVSAGAAPTCPGWEGAQIVEIPVGSCFLIRNYEAVWADKCALPFSGVCATSANVGQFDGKSGYLIVRTSTMLNVYPNTGCNTMGYCD